MNFENVGGRIDWEFRKGPKFSLSIFPGHLKRRSFDERSKNMFYSTCCPKWTVELLEKCSIQQVAQLNKLFYSTSCSTQQFVLYDKLFYSTSCSTRQIVILNKMLYSTSCSIRQIVLLNIQFYLALYSTGHSVLRDTLFYATLCST